MLLFSLPIFKDSKYTDESENIIPSGVSNSLLSHGLQPARLLCPWNSPGKNIGVEPFPSPGDLPNPGIEPVSPALQVDSLLSEPPVFLPGEFHGQRNLVDYSPCCHKE